MTEKVMFIGSTPRVSESRGMSVRVKKLPAPGPDELDRIKEKSGVVVIGSNSRMPQGHRIFGHRQFFSKGSFPIRYFNVLSPN